MGFFKHPQPQNSKFFVKKDIELFLTEKDEVKSVGFLTVCIRFNFDHLRATSRGPFLEAMPTAKLQQDEELS
jgi:hypothetical protein